jgi:hypothetical protein
VHRKPASLESLYPMSATMFRFLQRSVPVEGRVLMDLSDVDLPESALRDPGLVAAYAMRRLQATRYVSSPLTTTGLGVTMSCLSELIVQLMSIDHARSLPGASDTWTEAGLTLLKEFPLALREAVGDLRAIKDPRGGAATFYVVITGSSVSDEQTTDTALYL